MIGKRQRLREQVVGRVDPVREADAQRLRGINASAGEEKFLRHRDPDACRTAAALTAEWGNGLDVWVNNAGVLVTGPAWEATDEARRLMFEVNALGTMHGTFAALEQMRPAGRGHVVNITTSLVDHADSQSPSALTSLTKGGLAAVTRSLATEYASRGVRVNAVSLGVIKTPAHDPASYDGLAALHPLGRVGEISDVADGILYLERAGFVTGETLHIDGGQAAGH